MQARTEGLDSYLSRTHPLPGLPATVRALQSVSVQGCCVAACAGLLVLWLHCTAGHQLVVRCNRHQTFQRINRHGCCSSGGSRSFLEAWELQSRPLSPLLSLDEKCFAFALKAVVRLSSVKSFGKQANRTDSVRSSFHLDGEHLLNLSKIFKTWIKDGWDYSSILKKQTEHTHLLCCYYRPTDLSSPDPRSTQTLRQLLETPQSLAASLRITVHPENSS